MMAIERSHHRFSTGRPSEKNDRRPAGGGRKSGREILEGMDNTLTALYALSTTVDQKLDAVVNDLRAATSEALFAIDSAKVRMDIDIQELQDGFRRQAVATAVRSALLTSLLTPAVFAVLYLVSGLF